MTTTPQAALKAAREALLETVRKYGDVGTRDVDVARKRDAIAKAVEAIDTLSEIAAEEAQDWQLVPREPNKRMLRAGGDTGCFITSDEDARDHSRDAGTVYEAMLAAAPGAGAPSRSAEFERGRQQGIEQEHALWLLAKEGQRADATEARDEIMRKADAVLVLVGRLADAKQFGVNRETAVAALVELRTDLVSAVSRALGLEG